jgi:hypothetical protein
MAFPSSTWQGWQRAALRSVALSGIADKVSVYEIS